MILQDNILVVVDPAHSEHLALGRAVQFAGRQRHSTMHAHIFVGYEGQDWSNPDHPEEAIRGRDWLGELLVPLEKTGVKFEACYCWTQNWEESIINVARRNKSDLIMMDRSSAINKTGFTDSRWSLLRNSEVPILTVQPGAPAKRENILVAVNMQTTDERYQALNEKLLLQGQAVAEFYDAKLHVVNAHEDSEDYPDREKVRRIVDIERKDIYVRTGRPEEVIAKAAAKAGADLVVMGTMSRRGLRAALRGNISEKIIERLSTDVLMVTS